MKEFPTKEDDIYVMGVCGTGMGAFAGLMKSAGFKVRGSDQNMYSPMKEKLEEWQIEVQTPYAASNLEPNPDFVVVGNVIPKINVEASEMREAGIAYASFPQMMSELFLKDRHSMVVSGTHGKTTTSTLLAFCLDSCGHKPGFLIGGIPQNFSESFQLGDTTKASPFVIEGDEYDTAYFDKAPKFLHYRPQTLILTSVEFDHADIYDNIDQIKSRFRQLVELVPAGGSIRVYENAEHIKDILKTAEIKCTDVQSYGTNGDWDYKNFKEDALGISFRPTNDGIDFPEMKIELSGKHNLLNALAVFSVLIEQNIAVEKIQKAFAAFTGIKRRMEIKGVEKGVVVIDDFAHHPTAVRMTLDGAAQKYEGKEIWALFEPRSATSCRKIFQKEYAESFASADRVMLAPTGRSLDPEIALDLVQLARDVQQSGVKCANYGSIESMVEIIKAEAKANTVILCMSNGSFSDIHNKILNALKSA